jgi:hypothetical protein
MQSEQRMLTREIWRKSVRSLIAIAVLLLVASMEAGLEKAAWFVACGVVGYLNAFYAVRCLTLLVSRGKARRGRVLVAAMAVTASAPIVYCGYGIILALTTTVFVLIDALVLQFR